jgi:hypothetical protein
MNRRILRRLLVAVVTLLSFASVPRAEARVGWTLQDFEAGYGRPFGKAQASLPESEGEAYFYEKVIPTADVKLIIRVRAEFKDGKAWLVRYSARFKETEIRELLEKNKPDDDDWGEVTNLGSRKFYFTKKTRSRCCTWYKVGDQKVIWMMSEEAFQSMGRQRKAEIDYVKSQPADWEPSFLAKPQNDAAPKEGEEPAVAKPVENENSRLKGL